MTDSSPAAHNGEKRPADVISAAIMVARIATGEIEGAKGKLYLDFLTAEVCGDGRPARRPSRR